MTAAERCQAEFDYDFKRWRPVERVPLSTSACWRVDSYRQEWAYARHFIRADGSQDDQATAPVVSVLESYSSSASLQCALLELSSAERRLIRQLFGRKSRNTRSPRT